VTVWDATNGKELPTLSDLVGSVRSVAWSQDGKRLANASYYKRAKVSDTANGKELLTLKGHDGDVWFIRDLRP